MRDKKGRAHVPCPSCPLSELFGVEVSALFGVLFFLMSAAVANQAALQDF
jgi:hypothetical protein